MATAQLTTVTDLVAVKLERGDEVCSTLGRVVEELGLAGAAVVASVGSFSDAAYSLPGVLPDGRVTYVDVRTAAGLMSVVSLTGNFGRDAEGVVRHHLHSSFVLEDGRVIGGHLWAATVLATAEVTLARGPAWVAAPGPAVDDRQAWVLAPGS